MYDNVYNTGEDCVPTALHGAHASSSGRPLPSPHPLLACSGEKTKKRSRISAVSCCVECRHLHWHLSSCDIDNRT